MGIIFVGGISLLFFFFFNDTATTEIYTLSLHDALPILRRLALRQRGTEAGVAAPDGHRRGDRLLRAHRDRKSTRLNSSHGYISYAVFCLKKKKKHSHGSGRLTRVSLSRLCLRLGASKDD